MDQVTEGNEFKNVQKTIFMLRFSLVFQSLESVIQTSLNAIKLCIVHSY